MNLGLIDLDTSHPANWVPILRNLGHEVVGVYDHGDIHSEGYAATFTQTHGIAHVFEDIEALADSVDAAIIHSCDWDTHLGRAQPLLSRGKPVLIDKPLAGNMADLDRLIELEQQGLRITGGSSLRFCQEVRAFWALPADERGEVETAFVACGVDEYNYGIHAYAMLLGLMGTGAAPVSVQHLGSGRQRRVRVDWADGRAGFIVVGPMSKWLPFAATVVTDQQIAQITADTTTLYRSLLEVAMPYLASQTDEPPLPMAELVLPERCAIAARTSWMQGDRVVRLDEPAENYASYDGNAFAQEYRQQQLAKQKLTAQTS